MIQGNFLDGTPRLLQRTTRAAPVTPPAGGSKLIGASWKTRSITTHVPTLAATTEKRLTAVPDQVVHRLGKTSAKQWLPRAVQRQMEAAFRQSFDGVRIHLGPEAASIGARAFTFGENIYVDPEHFAPHTLQGRRLLAHELTHVVQQRQGRVPGGGTGVTIVQDPELEREADRMAEQIVLPEARWVQRSVEEPARPRRRPAMVRRRAMVQRSQDPTLEELQKRLVGNVDHDYVLKCAPESTPKEVIDEGACGALCTAFTMLGLTSEGTPDWTDYFGDRGEMASVVLHQSAFRKLVLKDIDQGYAYLFKTYLLDKLAEMDHLEEKQLQASGLGVICTFEFKDKEESGGHGCACVRLGNDVYAIDPNEGVFKVPLKGWHQWVEKYLLSAYGRIKLMTVYVVRKHEMTNKEMYLL